MKIVLDSGIFMNINNLPDLNGEIYLTNSVIDEIKSYQTQHIFEIAISNSKFTVLEPGKKNIQKIKLIAKNMGQNKLSTTDVEILALALELSEEDKVLLYTEDFAMKNVAKQIGIKSISIKNKGGNQKRTYYYKCKGCGEKYFQHVIDCEICGNTEFKRFRN